VVFSDDIFFPPFVVFLLVRRDSPFTLSRKPPVCFHVHGNTFEKTCIPPKYSIPIRIFWCYNKIYSLIFLEEFDMKVLLINGSPRAGGCTFTALSQVAQTLEEEGIETEIFQLGNGPIRDCIACGACAKLDCQCVFSDDCVNELLKKAQEADGFVFGTPVYYAHPSGRILSVLDRAFFAGSSAFTHKPAFAIASARRAGTTASFDVLNKYFTINQMPVVASTYWNNVHGACASDVAQDEEGLQIMRNGARNMAWLLRCIQLGKENGVPAPQAERGAHTNFIR
jgi:multimeric flavodoxin WrbA